MKHHILCINSGSSSIKFAMYGLGESEELIADGAVERIGLPGGWLWLKDAQGKRLADRHDDFPAHTEAVKAMFATAMAEHRFPDPDGVGHRLVHGGPKHTAPERVTPELMHTLRNIISLAPLHLPGELKGIDAISEHYPGLSQAACFDTAFHSRMPEIAKLLPLVRSLRHEGIYRYGFHGLSYEYVTSVLKEALQGRVIIAHLGNGASMAALKDGRPQDTTMGLTALGGLMMGTRSGDLDPGILLYLMDEKGYDARQLERLLHHRSGLLGVSGISSDMKTLLEKRAAEPHAAQAIELFCHIARKHIGALSATTGGIDTLVFTGGIGERAAPVRRMICNGLDYLGINLDPVKNDLHADIISTENSPCTVRVIHTDEDLMIARHTRDLLFGNTMY
ncbi:MAG TPA: acetate/propionate family kinase [Syntrophobacteraceae bacterium]|nr:acetate/propionate family kinase [Syntrophobacteraceae bacterium]